MARPTKDVDMAIMRLRRSARFLICEPPGKYGGSIAGDLEAVLRALEHAREPSASPVQEGA